MVKIATPTFEGTGEDDVALIDAYGAPDTEVKNELQSKVQDFNDNISGNIDKALAKGKPLTDKGKQLQSKLAMGMDKARLAMDYKRRIDSALKGDRSAILGLSQSLQDSMGINLSGVDSVLGFVTRASEFVESFMFVKDGVRRVLQGDASKLGTLMGLMNTVSGSRIGDTLDIGVYTSFVGEMINEMQSWPAPDFLDDLFKGKQDNDGNWSYEIDDDVRFQIGANISSQLGEANDLEWLERLIEHVEPEALLAKNPEFPLQLLSNYVFPPSLIPGEAGDAEEGERNYATELATLVKILDRLKFDWFETKRGDIPVWNLHFISHASEHATILLLSDAKYRDAMLTAPFYKVESFRESVLAVYPLYPF